MKRQRVSWPGEMSTVGMKREHWPVIFCLFSITSRFLLVTSRMCTLTWLGLSLLIGKMIPRYLQIRYSKVLAPWCQKSSAGYSNVCSNAASSERPSCITHPPRKEPGTQWASNQYTNMKNPSSGFSVCRNHPHTSG